MDVHANPLKPRTEFVKLTMKRAVTPRWKSRAVDLLNLEQALIARKWGALTVGKRIDTLGARYPVSLNMIVREINGSSMLSGAVSVAEAVELQIWK
ncbi:MAG: hypothetical protein HKN18_09795 [Silicimonas sp.]|nr:hypothetical protein [Silicimonas sp.]